LDHGPKPTNYFQLGHWPAAAYEDSTRKLGGTQHL
jgi:hypothetical protein